MRLDLDLTRLKPDERMGDRASEHPIHGRHESLATVWRLPEGCVTP
jgi:hypothetical protein